MAQRMTSKLLTPHQFEFRVAKGVGALAQRLVYGEEELLVSLSNSLKLREQEIANRDSLTGRLMALFSGKDPGDSIQIDGKRLNQLHDLAGSTPREQINLNAFYDVNLEYFRVLLDKARKAAALNARKAEGASKET